MNITSEAVQADGTIMAQYACEGDNTSPPLTFSDIPADTQSLALVLEDPDVPGRTFIHWLLYDMSPATLQIVENSMPLTGVAGLNDFGITGYGGPCPPPGSSHRYVFTLYALDVVLDLPPGIGKDEIMQAAEGHVLESAELIATYRRHND